MTMAADGSRLMARLDDSTVATWDVAAGTEIQHAEEPKLKLGAMAPHGKVFWAANLVDANRLLEGEALQPFSVDDRKALGPPCVVTLDLLTGLGNVECLAAGGVWAAAGCRDGTVALVKANETKVIGQWLVERRRFRQRGVFQR